MNAQLYIPPEVTIPGSIIIGASLSEPHTNQYYEKYCESQKYVMQFRSKPYPLTWIWLKMNFHDTVYIYEENTTVR